MKRRSEHIREDNHTPTYSAYHLDHPLSLDIRYSFKGPEKHEKETRALQEQIFLRVSHITAWLYYTNPQAYM
jgi:hypothetical protein